MRGILAERLEEREGRYVQQAWIAVTLLENEVLCRTGEPADQFWLITSGSLRVSDQIEEEAQGVQRRTAPAIIGEMAPSAGRPRSGRPP